MTTGTSKQSLRKLGPALVAGVAYLDPGNFASNLASGALFKYSLIWVVLVANLFAWFVQYLAAKLAIGTGQSLTELIAHRSTRLSRWAYWAQAEIVVLATETAEVVGGAVALNILFNIPLGLGAAITAAASMVILSSKGRLRGTFTAIIIGLTAVTALGIVASIQFGNIDLSALWQGLVPRLRSQSELLISLGIFGATVMPHAIYSHSAFVRDKFGKVDSVAAKRVLLRVSRIDVTIALAIAGLVNLCILLVGATILSGSNSADPIYATFSRLAASASPVLAVLFAVALLASGLASSTVGAYAGSEVMNSLIKHRVAPWLRRAITVVPAILILQFAANPTTALLWSQVFISFGIPFALIPLLRLTSAKKLMAELTNRRLTIWAGVLVSAILIALNLKFVFDALTGLGA